MEGCETLDHRKRLETRREGQQRTFAPHPAHHSSSMALPADLAVGPLSLAAQATEHSLPGQSAAAAAHTVRRAEPGSAAHSG